MDSTYSTLFHRFRKALTAIYAESEAAAIAREVLQSVTGLSYTQGLIRTERLSTAECDRLEVLLQQLVTGMPMQYALGFAWFAGRKFCVNDSVLIPRPETEELVYWIAEESGNKTGVRMIDIGTGSGCIPITLKSMLTNASIEGIDISEEALLVAQKNADDIGVDVTFRHLDFLHAVQRSMLGMYDVIVSNPPYIPLAEAEVLDANVRDWEPHTALFVPNGDPLLFYRVIAEFGKERLGIRGAIYCEMHEDYALNTEGLFREYGYEVMLRKDVHGKDRMLRARSGG